MAALQGRGVEVLGGVRRGLAGVGVCSRTLNRGEFPGAGEWRDWYAGAGHRRLIWALSPQEVGRMKIELFADVVPKTAENFRYRVTGPAAQLAAGL